MADKDIVKHDLKVTVEASSMNWDDFNEPDEWPVANRLTFSQLALLETKPPVTTLVTDEELVTAPYRSVGKFGYVRNGGGRGGSGWVAARRAFFTAGHCIFNSELGGWITKGTFIPRFKNGVGAAYQVETIYTFKAWVDSMNLVYDMAACVVTENFAATEPPLAFNTGLIPALTDNAIGYPIRPIRGHAFNGKRMWKCLGEFVKLENDVQYASNNMSGGSSGGPWCDVDENNEVTGLTSARDDDANLAQSPLFGNGFQILYDAVKDL